MSVRPQAHDVAMDNTRQALLRLKRRLGREAARHERMCESMRERGAIASMERAYGEANVLRMAQGFVDEELRRLDAP